MTNERAKWGSKQNIRSRINYKLKNCYDIFNTEIMHGPRQESILCRLHDMFPTKNDNDHVSIGCSLNDAAEGFDLFLKKYRSTGKIKYDLPQIIFAFYLFTAKIEEVLKLLNKGGDNINKMEIFTTIRKWANFIKHPKHFIYLAHHCLYNFENSQINLEFEPKVIIDTKFVLKYYNSRDKQLNDELNAILNGVYPVLVLYPDIIKFTRDLCSAIHNFLDIIATSPEHQETLINKAVMKDFFDNYIGD